MMVLPATSDNVNPLVVFTVRSVMFPARPMTEQLPVQLVVKFALTEVRFAFYVKKVKFFRLRYWNCVAVEVEKL
jgi:hypothetical protein